jgi:hypothetical protein
MREGHGHRGRHGYRELGEHREHGHHHHKSAQTFRRGRALAFLEKLQVNQATLKRQLNDPELESIKGVISGELKATETIMDEFIHMFQLHETAAEEQATDVNPNDERA